ncbi:dephospho-CoA kinase [Enterococcus sp. PF1-24]|uniref:dephospho-CoA kinase n=1 Tax=unclassified Enterococcus TaxID=2608891 RepID=UPI002472F19B|nr:MULTISPECIES: dephospho-CoA kinase [unclassified Enterococcus]MDH6364204.1 dephospho-CoA kinase [Enterococcus sp. PFB1-1]MDH6401305.1 dephospho-CoA kinase [Enterococcus sp. PF1-24]
MSLVLGLTGGIATGKSSVSAIFRKYNFPVIDADLIARQIVEPNQPALNDLVAWLGKDILTTTGELNRKKLAELVFNKSEELQKLNALLHPYIYQEMVKEIATAKKDYPLVIIDVPLLIETEFKQLADEIMLVYIPESLQLQRLMKRDNLTETAALKRISSQLSIEEKRTFADFIVDNQGTLSETEAQVVDWLKAKYFL